MLKSLKNIFANEDISPKEENADIDLLSGLMIEAAYTDGQITQDELNKISTSLVSVFKEDSKNVNDSLARAIENKDNSKSLYFYSSKLHKSFPHKKKIILIEVLWEIILSDNEIHDFEANLIRRLAGLLYISDVECGNAKLRAEEKVKSK